MTERCFSSRQHRSRDSQSRISGVWRTPLAKLQPKLAAATPSPHTSATDLSSKDLHTHTLTMSHQWGLISLNTHLSLSVVRVRSRRLHLRPVAWARLMEGKHKYIDGERGEIKRMMDNGTPQWGDVWEIIDRQLIYFDVHRWRRSLCIFPATFIRHPWDFFRTKSHLNLQTVYKKE